MGRPLYYNKTYRTYDELMAEIEDELSTYADQGFIESDKYIKVIEKCNSFLSVKINPTKHEILYVKDHKVKLPDDFKLWERGFICHSKTEHRGPVIRTRNTIVNSKKKDCNSCESCGECEETCTHTTVVTEELKSVTMDYQVPLILTHPHYTCSDCQPTALHNGCEVNIELDGDDKYLITGFQEGTIVIGYTVDMVSSENIIMYDHPLVREYYEYAVKERIFEDIWLNGKEEVFKRFQLATEKHRQSKIEAKRFVNTPDFNDLRSYHAAKRKRSYNKYFAPLYEKPYPKHLNIVYPSYHGYHLNS